jgi:hypothetical protein
VKAIDVSPLDASLLDAVLRLVKLVESPTDARVLAPLVTREIVYRLLEGAQGARLRHIAVLGEIPIGLRWQLIFYGEISSSHRAWNALPKSLA